MNESKISVRYAKALFKAAREGKLLPQVMKDMEQVMRVYSMDDFRAVLESPIVKTSDKKKVFQSLFSGKLTDLSLNFFDLLLTNKRENHLPHIARYFSTLYKSDQGILSAEITVAGKIDAAQAEKFKTLLKKTFKAEIELETNVRADILGGFILRVEDEQYDGSVASQLTKIKRQLLDSTLVK